MRARLIIIDRVRGQNPPQMPFAKDQDVIQAVAPKRPDQAFNIGGFCQGDLGEIGRSRIPMARTRSLKVCP